MCSTAYPTLHRFAVLHLGRLENGRVYPARCLQSPTEAYQHNAEAQRDTQSAIDQSTLLSVLSKIRCLHYRQFEQAVPAISGLHYPESFSHRLSLSTMMETVSPVFGCILGYYRTELLIVLIRLHKRAL